MIIYKKKNLQTKVLKCLVDFIILKQLSNQSTHGYQIITQTRKLLGVYFGSSTIYPLLTAYEKNGYVTSHWEIFIGRPRKVYTITKEGQIMLNIIENSINLIQMKSKHQVTAEPEIIFREVILEPHASKVPEPHVLA